MLAFVRSISYGNTDLYVLPLTADCQPAGEARHLNLPQPWVTSPAWTADGQYIVCEAGLPWAQRAMLWRVSYRVRRNRCLWPLGKGLTNQLARDREIASCTSVGAERRQLPSGGQKYLAVTNCVLRCSWSPRAARRAVQCTLQTVRGSYSRQPGQVIARSGCVTAMVRIQFN